MLLFVLLMGVQANDVAARARDWARKAEVVASCKSDNECAEKWKAAGSWIQTNSRFQIAVNQPDILATYPPVYADTGLSFVIEKRAHPAGGFDIAARAWCGNVFKCNPKPKRAIEDLRSALR